MRKLYPFLILGLTAAITAQSTRRVPADYPTIQAAVDAARHGDRILVARGTYQEQVTIHHKDLTLIGSPGAILEAPLSMQQTLLPGSERRAILGVHAARVNVRGFTVDGARRGNSNLFFNGIVLLGANGSISDCRIVGVRQEPLALDPQSAPIRVLNPVALGTRAVDVSITSNTVSDCFDGITLTGDADHPDRIRVHALVVGNSVTGSGPTDVLTEFGINFQVGVSGGIAANAVRNCIYTGMDGFAVGILQNNGGATGHLPRVWIQGNRCLGNQVGIAAIFSARSLILGNHVHGGAVGFAGIAVSGNDNRIVANHVADHQFGIGLIGAEFQVYGLAVDTLVAGNWLQRSSVLPIWEQTNVTGSVIVGNRITP